MPVQNIKKRVLVFPSEGRLLIASDLHGHKNDYLKILSTWVDLQEQGEDVHMLFLGDLIHGPAHPDTFSPILEYNHDDSEFIVDHFMRMRQLYPDKIFSLLGNHEHAHIGGPHTRKFHQDEVDALEEKVGKEKSEQYKQFFETFPLVALTSTGIAFTHGAGSSKTDSLSQIINANYNISSPRRMEEMYNKPVFDMLWRRGGTEAEARQFLSVLGSGNNLLVYGHDVVLEGYDSENERLLCISTSFGLEDHNKYYVDIDLSKRYENASQLQIGVELKRLWDKPAPVDPMEYEFGKAAMEQGLTETALYALRNAPESGLRDYLIGRTLLGIKPPRIERVTEAIHSLQRAITQEPGLVDAHLFLGQAYAMQGGIQGRRHALCSYSRSLAHLREAESLDPRNMVIVARFSEAVNREIKRCLE